jgi:peptide/nickel transport system ATP-binding protein
MAKWDYDGPILEIENLSISFFTRLREIPAVMDFSCVVQPGEAMGLVGESGCGKSTVALGVMQDLGVNGKIVGGTIKFKGRNLNDMSPEELREIRGSEIAMIYQEPMASLNPAMKIGRQLMEVPMIHEGVSEKIAYNRALEVVTDVKLPDPKRILGSYPHQLSGGQQQRIVIAMALMSKPSLLILDEPTTALDVTVEAAVVELVKDLGKKYGTSMLFISHNLGLVLETCDRICVMYSGEAVETGSIEDVFDKMQHPYTQALFRCPVPTKTHVPWWQSPATSPCLMSGQMAVILAHAAIISKRGAAMPMRSRWPKSQNMIATARVA